MKKIGSLLFVVFFCILTAFAQEKAINNDKLITQVKENVSFLFPAYAELKFFEMSFGKEKTGNNYYMADGNKDEGEVRLNYRYYDKAEDAKERFDIALDELSPFAKETLKNKKINRRECVVTSNFDTDEGTYFSYTICHDKNIYLFFVVSAKTTTVERDTARRVARVNKIAKSFKFLD
ncbi:hypothetical protein AAIR98_000284 [Elusimicrobium simillimum]|uniref:hypothetical protein n=1 Tax=Elusimicrobium simillimum TaxID=3143438 RepID=UPI003C6F5E8E